MKKLTVYILISLISTTLFAQEYNQLDINNWLAGFYQSGINFNEGDTLRSAIPKGSGKTTIYSSTFWIEGKINDTLHISAQMYENTNFSAGPVADNFDEDYIHRYDRVWKLSKAEIDYHKANYNNSGYIISPNILTWPGNGNTQNGEAANLAPYVDVNNNSIYDPKNGDYPKIRGDQAIFYIYNDKISENPLGVEIHVMAYAYKTNNALNNTLFVNYKIYNRTINNYDSVFIGIFTDLDIGTASDDFIGCDSTRNAYFGYNKPSHDNIYGDTVPAQAVVILNHNLTSFINDYPSSQNDYHNLLHAMWTDGTHLTYGGNGHNPDSRNTNFLYEINSNWHQLSSMEVRGIGSIGPFTINSKSNISLDIAFPWSNSPTNNTMPSVDTLLKDIDFIQEFYDNQNFNSINNNITKTNNIIIFPNPAKDMVHIACSLNKYNVTVRNINGQILIQQKNAKQINLTGFNKGIYFVTISNNSTITTKKIIVE